MIQSWSVESWTCQEWNTCSGAALRPDKCMFSRVHVREQPRRPEVLFHSAGRCVLPTIAYTTTHNTTTLENFDKTLKHQNWPKSVWPKAVKTTIGQSLFGQSRSRPRLAKVCLAKVGHDGAESMLTLIDAADSTLREAPMTQRLQKKMNSSGSEL